MQGDLFCTLIQLEGCTQPRRPFQGAPHRTTTRQPHDNRQSAMFSARRAAELQGKNLTPKERLSFVRPYTLRQRTLSLDPALCHAVFSRVPCNENLLVPASQPQQLRARRAVEYQGKHFTPPRGGFHL